MKDIRVRKAVRSYVPTNSDWSIDDLCQEKEQADAETVAKEITGPLIESLRKDLEKIDVSAFKKQ